ncbi:MAG: tetratricopeptide repeat protein, partial [Candidatus Latescibacterota bacterium]
ARDIRPDWDEPYLRLGEIYQYRGERSVAVQMFDKALEICPSVDGWCGKGNVLQTKGLVDSAEMAYKMAVEHNPDHDRPYYDLGRLYYYGVGDLEEAERMARRGIEVRPDRDRSYELLKEVLCYGRGRFQEAEELIRGFVDRYPYNFDAYDHLYDYLQYDKGDLWSARLRVAEDAVARNPDRVWPYLMLASAYADKTGGEAKYEKAVEAVQKALEMRPKSGRVLHGAGAIYAYLGDSEKAHHYYRCAMEASPGNPNILAYMAHLFIGEAHFDSAATVAATLIRQAPGMGYSYNLMGTALTHLMRTDEFLTIMQDAADRYGQDDPWFYVWLGDAWRLSGKFREAADSYSRVLDLKKFGSKVNLDMVQESLRGLGITQWLSGDTDGALASFSEAASTETEGSFTLYEMMVIPLMKYLGRIDEIEVKLNDLRKDGLIDSWIYHAIYYYPSLRQFDGTLRAVEQALDNDEVTFKPWLVMRTAAWYRQKGDFAKAKRILREVEPSVKDNYQEWIDHEWANIEAIRGSLELAIQFARKAYKEVDYSQRNKPISLLSRLYYASGRTRDALDVLAKANGFQGNIDAFYQKAQMALVTQSSDADEELSRAHLLAMRGSRGSDWDWGLGRAHIYAALTSAHIGDEERARSEIEYAIKLEPERADIAYHVAAVYSLLGNTSSALQWLEKSVERGHQELWWARVDPDLDSLRELPRFQEIMSDWDARMRALVD